MKLELKSDKPVTDEACKAETGKTISEWFGVIDSLGGLKAGRRAITVHLTQELKIDGWWSATLNVLYEANHKAVEKDGRGKGFNICVTKMIAAPVEKVYDAWVKESELSEWFGPQTKADVKDGGTFSNADGDAGTYLRVRPGKDLRIRWERADCEPSMIDVAFTDKGGKTYLLVNLDRVQNREEADGLRRAWNDATARLKSRLEA